MIHLIQIIAMIKEIVIVKNSALTFGAKLHKSVSQILQSVIVVVMFLTSSQSALVHPLKTEIVDLPLSSFSSEIF